MNEDNTKGLKRVGDIIREMYSELNKNNNNGKTDKSRT